VLDFLYTKNFIKYLIGIVLYTTIFSCSMKTYLLLDKITDVPLSSSVYKNKSKFDTSLLTTIDTSVVYEEYDMNKNIVMSLDKCTACRGYRVYKFYSNGCLNMFFLTEIALCQ